MSISVDDELRARLADTEDQLIERKESAQRDEIKKAAVAFANSLAEGTTAVLFLGVKADGKPSGKLGNADEAQRKVRPYLSECYPPLPCELHAVCVEGTDVLAVRIFPSTMKPHFTGKSYVRKGSETIEASDSALGLLLDQRVSLVAALTPYIGQKLSVQMLEEANEIWSGVMQATLLAVNAHFVRLRFDSKSQEKGVSLARILLEWDYHKTACRPMLRVSP